MQFGPRTFFFVLLLLALPIAAYWFLFKPLTERENAAKLEIQDKSQQLQTLHQALAGRTGMKGEIEELRKAISFLESRLPEEKEMDKVLKEVWQLAEKHDLNTRSVRSLKVTQGANYSEQPIRMVIYGKLKEGFYPFLWEVEHLPRLTKISEMKIDAEEKTGKVTADFVLTIYFEGTSQQKVAVAQ